MSQIELANAARHTDAPCSLRYQPFVLCLLAVVAGILIDAQFDLDYRIYAGIGLTTLAWIGLFRSLSQGSVFALGTPRLLNLQSASHLKQPFNPSLRQERLMSLMLLLGWLALGAFWHHARWNWFGENDISRFVSREGTTCCLEGKLVSEPRWLAPNDSEDGMNYREGTVRTRFSFQAKSIRDGTNWKPVSGNLELVIREPVRQFRSGDEVRVFGKLVAVNPPSNPGQFNFQEFYRSQGKLVMLHANFGESVIVIRPASRSLFRPLSLLRFEFNEIVWRNLNPDQAAFAAALMLGNREQLSAERRESFIKTGTSHLLAISGLHVGILATTFFWLYRLGWVTRQTAIWLTIAFVVFYAWLVEFRPPAVRAAILIVTFCIGKLQGRQGFGFNLLALAGLIVLAFNPRDLFNLGAQLSFLAVATLNFGSAWIFWPPSNDPLDRLIASTRSWPVRLVQGLGIRIRSAFLVSAAIWFVCLPLVAYHFHLVAPVSLLVNPILLLPIALALYSGLAMLLLGLISTPLSQLPGKFCEWNLAFVERAIHWAEGVPGGFTSTAGPTLTALIVFYIGLFFTAIFPATKLRLRWILLLAVAWYVLAWWFPDHLNRRSWLRGQQPLVCTFIDVSHGSAVLLQMPDGKNMLYDAGSFGSAVYGYQNISSVLWRERIEYLDTVIISHADLDHYNALLELSQRFGIGEVVMTQRTRDSRSPAVRALLARFAELEIPLQIVATDSQAPPQTSSHISTPTSSQGSLQSSRPTGSPATWPSDPHLRLLSPPRGGTGGNDNSDSIVLAIEAYGSRLLLTGDLEGPGLERLLAQTPVPCDLVMAPHHGSFNSDPTLFMKWTNPSVVVISGETPRIRENSVAIFQQRDRAVFRTDLHGAIRCRLEPGQTYLQTWRADRWLTQAKIARQPRAWVEGTVISVSEVESLDQR